MRALVGEQILVAWERCRELPEQEAALALIELGWPEQPVEELARLPLAERNALLLELRATTLGRRMEGFVVCPECGAQLEFSLDARELANGLRAQPAEAVEERTEAFEELAGYAMRPANTLDLLACSEAGDEQQARSILLARTLLVKEQELDEAKLIERFDRLNASAEIRVQLQCAVCQSLPLLDLDIAHFLVREIAASARRLMAEIHELASAYGWSEQSIAGMSGARRAAYLEMLSA